MIISYDDLKVPQATIIQKKMRERVDIGDRVLNPKLIGGADISLSLFSKIVFAGIVVLDYNTLKPSACALVKSETRFPYVPGYLAFREIPALSEAWEMLKVKPDVLVCDGHGYSHPRRVGVATHFGILTGQTTIGCAKKKLFGTFREPGQKRFSYAALRDKVEVMGYALRTKENVKPVFISPGHLVGLKNTLQIMKHCTRRHRLPEPTRIAHEFVNRFRRGELEAGYHVL